MSYQALTSENYKALLGQPVTFQAKLAVGVLQHVMPSVLGPDFKPFPNLYLNPSKEVGLHELVAACPPELFDKAAWEGKNLRVSGTWRSVSGPGKGGGEHTEYYIILDGVEAL